MECEKCKSMVASINEMDEAVRRIERHIGWKIPVYALVALRELKLHVALAKEKLNKENESVKAP